MLSLNVNIQTSNHTLYMVHLESKCHKFRQILHCFIGLCFDYPQLKIIQMKSIKEKLQKYLTKSKWSIASDIIFILFIIALAIPQTRKPIMVGINKAKSFVFHPSIVDEENQDQLSKEDFKWRIQDINGDIVKLKEYEDKVIFINFWATWCPPCIAEMPSIQKLYDQYKDNENIQFVIITNDEKKVIDAFMEKEGFDFPVYTGIENAPDKLSTSAIPKTFIISKSGKIVLKKTGSANWGSDKIKSLIDGLIDEG